MNSRFCGLKLLDSVSILKRNVYTVIILVLYWWFILSKILRVLVKAVFSAQVRWPCICSAGTHAAAEWGRFVMSLIPVNESLSSEEHTQSAPCPELCPATSAFPNPIANLWDGQNNLLYAILLGCKWS